MSAISIGATSDAFSHQLELDDLHLMLVPLPFNTFALLVMVFILNQ